MTEDDRNDMVARLWLDGASMKDIADELGLPLDGVKARLHTMRKHGRNLPFRNASPVGRELTEKERRDVFWAVTVEKINPRKLAKKYGTTLSRINDAWRYEQARREMEREKAIYSETMQTIPKDTRSLSARLMGDPLPGRSALDMKRQEQANPFSIAVKPSATDTYQRFG